MGYDLYIHGVEPVSDDKKEKVQAVRDACRRADIQEPEEVETILGDGDEMCSKGRLVNIKVEDTHELNGEYCQYIDLFTLSRNVRYIRLWHSY